MGVFRSLRESGGIDFLQPPRRPKLILIAGVRAVLKPLVENVVPVTSYVRDCTVAARKAAPQRNGPTNGETFLSLKDICSDLSYGVIARSTSG